MYKKTHRGFINGKVNRMNSPRIVSEADGWCFNKFHARSKSAENAVIVKLLFIDCRLIKQTIKTRAVQVW